MTTSLAEIIAEGSPRMPGFKYQFSPDQITAIVAYLRTVPPQQSASAQPRRRPPRAASANASNVKRINSYGDRHDCSTLRVPGLAIAITLLIAAPAYAADPVLHGTINAPSGEPMAGATVSAKAPGTNITRTVFTDAQGNYYFPPLPAGKYQVWAQALTFATGRGDVDLAEASRQDFTLAPLKDFVRQLPGDVLLASLPSDTVDDKRMQRLVRNNCTGCHTPSYVLQHRFDQDGWSKIIGLMKHVNVGRHLPGRRSQSARTARLSSAGARRLSGARPWPG